MKLFDSETDKHIEFYFNCESWRVGFEVWDGDVLITSFELDRDEAQRFYEQLGNWL